MCVQVSGIRWVWEYYILDVSVKGMGVIAFETRLAGLVD